MSEAYIQDILNTKDRLIQTMLDMASDMAWSDMVFEDIIQNADVDEGMAKALFVNKDALLSSYYTELDQMLRDDFDNEFSDMDDMRDRLFEVLMGRFDLLNENRAAMISILNDVTMDPKQAMTQIPHVFETVKNIYMVASVGHSQWTDCIKISALVVLYLKSLRDWCRDETEDMAPTMASVDRGLDLFLRINF